MNMYKKGGSKCGGPAVQVSYLAPAVQVTYLHEMRSRGAGEHVLLTGRSEAPVGINALL